MIRYELCYWPEKENRVIIRYQRDGMPEVEVTFDQMLRGGIAANVEVTEEEIDIETEHIISRMSEIYEDKSDLAKQISALRTKAGKKSVKRAIESRKKDVRKRMLAKTSLVSAAKNIEKYVESIIKGL